MSISTTNDSNLDLEARPSTATEEELQLQIALTLSREKCKKAKEMKKSNDARLQLALEESQKQVDCRATSTTPQLSALSSDPFAAWKNPAALVPSVSLISSNSINLLGGYDECSNKIERLAFSLNNNCAVIPSTNMIPMMSSKAKAVVKFTYEPRLEDELCLTKGQYVNVIEKNTDGWWKGEAPNGSVGWFPSNYVEMLNNSTPPKTLSDMPIDVIGLIIEKSDYKEQLILRKTSKSLRTLVDKLKPACKRLEVFCYIDCIFCDYDDHRFAYVPPTWDHENFSNEWSDYREGKIKIILKTDYEKVAFEDLAFTLKNPKLQLENFEFDSVCDGDCCKNQANKTIYNSHGKMECVLKSLNHQLSVKACGVTALSFCSDSPIISYLKPKILEKIKIINHYDDKWRKYSEAMEQIARLDQWKQAKELEVHELLDKKFPVKHVTHFKRLHFELEWFHPKYFALIRNLISEHENIESCTILIDKDSSWYLEEFNDRLGTLVSPNLYHYTIPDSEYYLELLFSDNRLTIEKKKK